MLFIGRLHAPELLGQRAPEARGPAEGCRRRRRRVDLPVPRPQLLELDARRVRVVSDPGCHVPIRVQDWGIRVTISWLGCRLAICFAICYAWTSLYNSCQSLSS